MAYGLQVFNGGNEVLYSKPARYLLHTVQINPSVASHVTRYTLNLSEALPVGTNVYIAKVNDGQLATVDHVFIDNNPGSALDTLFVTAVSLNAGRTAVYIDTVMGRIPEVYWDQYDCKFYLISYRGSL